MEKYSFCTFLNVFEAFYAERPIVAELVQILDFWYWLVLPIEHKNLLDWPQYAFRRRRRGSINVEQNLNKGI